MKRKDLQEKIFSCAVSNNAVPVTWTVCALWYLASDEC